MQSDIYAQLHKSMAELQLLCKELSAKYPNIRAFNKELITDPDVAILLESFALLNAKLQNDIQQSQEQLPNILINMLHPEILAFMPPASVICIDAHNPCTVSHNTEVLMMTNNTEHTFHVIGNHLICNAVIDSITLMTTRHMMFANPTQQAIHLNITPAHDLKQFSLYISADNAQQMMSYIFRAKSQQDIYMLQDNRIVCIGYIKMLDIEPIYTSECSSPYYNLYNYAVMPMIYNFVDIVLHEPLVAKKQHTILIPVNSNDHMSLDVSKMHLNCVPIVNLYRKTSDPINIAIPQQSYKLTAGHTNIHSVQSISIYDPHTNVSDEYMRNSHVYFISTYLDNVRIFLSKIYINWAQLTNKMMHASVMCSDDISMQTPDRITVRNLNARNTVVVRPNKPRYLHNLNNLDHWLIQALMHEKIHALNDADLLQKIRLISRIYNMPVDDVFIDIKIYNSHCLNRHKNNNYRSSWVALTPKRIIEITINNYNAYFIHCLIWSRTLINLAALDDVIVVRFIDSDGEVLLTHEEDHM
jgi:hypothetical protein